MEKISSNNWESVERQPMAVIEFASSWCGPCKRQAEVLKEIAKSMGDVFMATVDIEESFDLTDKLGVRSVPTTIVMKNGKEKKRFVGNCSKESIEKELAVAV